MTYDLTGEFTQKPIAYSNKAWVVHHSVTATLSPSATQKEERAVLAQIDRYHRDVRGFSVGFGYHVAVFPSARSYRVGTQGTQRAHVANLNDKYDGLVFIGTFTQQAPNAGSLMEAAKVILASGMPLAGGHKNVAPQGYTECPGAWAMEQLRAFMDAPPVSKPLNFTQQYIMQSAARVAGLGTVRITPLKEQDGKPVYRMETR